MTIKEVYGIGLSMLNGNKFALPTATAPVPEESPKHKLLKVKVQKTETFPPVVTVDMDHVVMQGGEPVAVPDEPIDVPVVTPITPKKRGFRILTPVTEDVE
jgi:hypothetical protein